MSQDNSQNEKAPQMISLGGLWLKTAKNGKRFMVGNIGFDGKIFIFKNESKKSENSPDYFIYLTPGEKQEKPATSSDTDDVPF